MPTIIPPHATRMAPLPSQPVDARPLFRPLGQALVELLERLDPEDWSRPTSADRWRVRDVAAHLLDVTLRRISSDRDRHAPPPPQEPVTGYGELKAYLDALNATWIEAAQRLSARMITELLSVAGPALAEVMEATRLSDQATYPVAWAGQDSSPMWLDVGRDYTEHWHHQDQIRDAVGAPILSDERWLRPVVQISLMALPHAYRELQAPEGAGVVLRVEGPAGGTWTLTRADGTWILEGGDGSEAGQPGGRHCLVRVGDLALARLLLHRLTPAAARAALQVQGPEELAAPLLGARAVMV